MRGLYQIRASAGSGKTHTLTGRILALLAEGSELTEIVAITFTNAAAQEMRSRVLTRLKLCALALSSELPQKRAQKILSEIVSVGQPLQVRTIDSLLLQIVRTASLSLNISPDFTPVFTTDETVAPFLEILSARALAGDKKLSGELAAIVSSLYQENEAKGFGTARILTGLTPLFSSILLRECEDIPPASLVAEKRKEVLEEIPRLCSAFLELCPPKALLAKAKQVLELLARPEVSLKDIRHALTSSYLAKENASGLFRKAYAPKDNRLDELYQKITSACRKSVLFGECLATLPFIAFGKSMVAAYNSSENAPFCLHTVLIPRLVQAIFAGLVPVSDALFSLGNSLTHLLIDEFQDTSDEQWQALLPLVLEGLSHGGSFTWVGDIKQSIFSWRGGNPDLFDQILTSPQLARVSSAQSCESLPCNWRSRKDIVDFNNRLFAPLSSEDSCRLFLERCLPQSLPEHLREEALRNLTHAYAGLAQTLPSKTDPDDFAGRVSLDLCEPEELKEKILSLVRDYGTRGQWSDTLILMRTNAECTDLAESLLSHGIPVVTENSLLLSRHGLIVESIAFLSFLSGRNELDLYTVLSGQIFHLPEISADFSLSLLEDTMLKGLKSDTDEKMSRSSVESSFRALWPELWQRFLVPFIRAAHELTPYDLLSEWYTLMRVEQRFPKDTVFLRRLLEILYTAGSLAGTLSVFLEYWEKNSAAEKVPMPEQMNAVRIMTVHKAKGLEAKLVIYPHHRMKLVPMPRLIFHQTEDGLRLPMRLKKSLGAAYYSDLLRMFSESINLLYVACTRARDELCLLQVGDEKSREKDILSSLLDLAGMEVTETESMGETQTRPEQPITGPEEITRENQDLQGTEVASSDFWRPMQWLPGLKIARSRQSDARKLELMRAALLGTALERLRLDSSLTRAAEAALEESYILHKIRHRNQSLDRDIMADLLWYLHLPGVSDWLLTGQRKVIFLDCGGKALSIDLVVQQRSKAEARSLFIQYETRKNCQACDCTPQIAAIRAIGEIFSVQKRPWLGLIVQVADHALQEIGEDKKNDLSLPTLFPSATASFPDL